MLEFRAPMLDFGTGDSAIRPKERATAPRTTMRGEVMQVALDKDRAG